MRNAQLHGHRIVKFPSHIAYIRGVISIESSVRVCITFIKTIFNEFLHHIDEERIDFVTIPFLMTNNMPIILLF